MTRDWKPPSDLTASETHAVVEPDCQKSARSGSWVQYRSCSLPVCNDDTDTNEQWLRRDQSSSTLCFTQFTLVHWDRRCFDTRTNPSDPTSNNDMRNRICCCLQHSTDLGYAKGISKQPFPLGGVTYNDEDHGDPHGSSPSEPFAYEKVQDTPGECSEIVRGDDDAF